ncbi:hypothetical protein G6F43_011480 [Rhizopus delemar]|nr:hypothetical protein G6F43_011480 [Rhizopus delemar]
MLISSITQRTKITPYSFNLLFQRYLSSENIITAEDPIHKIDLRVGKIIDINNHPEATHLYIEKVDLSAEQTDSRTIDRNVIVVSNLKASKFRGVLSQGMLLAASLENKVETLSPPSTATLGERVQLEGIALGEAVDVLKPKQKILEQVVQYLKTNQNGIATYKGIPLVTSQGPVSCDIKQGQIS